MTHSRRAGVLALALCWLSQDAAADRYSVRKLVGPGPFHGVHGLAFGPDGGLYAADIAGSSIHRVALATGRHRVVVGPPLGNADDLAFGPAASVSADTMVWSGISVGKLFAKTGHGKPRLIASNMPGINAVGFAPDGMLYVTQSGRSNKALWRVDLSGQQAPEKLWEGGGLNGFVITPAGDLYAPEAALGRVVRLDLNSLELTVLADGFKLPTAVALDPHGNLLVLDFDAGTVTQVDLDTGARVLLASIEPGLDNMTVGPPDSALANKLYISSIGANGIYELDLDTRALRSVVAGHLTAPGGVAVVGTGNRTRIYVADMYSLRVVNRATGAVTTLIPISAAGAYPTSVSHGRWQGREVLLTASWFTGRIQLIAPDDGAVLREEQGFAAPYAVLMLADGSWLVAEAGAAKLTRVSPDGARETWADGFELPVGLALAPAAGRSVYVTDAEAGTITGFDLATGARRQVADGFKQAEGVAVLADGSLAVVDSAARKVYRVDAATGRKRAIATRIPVGLQAPGSQPRAWVFNGIAAATDGMLYLPTDRNAGLVALRPEVPGAGATQHDFDEFLAGWAGDYDNSAQVRRQQATGRPANERNNAMTLYIRRVDLPAFGEHVYYGEWRDGIDASNLVRQRIYVFELDAELGIRLNLHVWPADNAEFVVRTRGAHLDTTKLAGVTPADMFGLVGCDVFFHKTRDGFAGSMRKGACAFPAPGGEDKTVYSWSQMKRTPSQFSYLDGWYNVDGSPYRRFAVDWNVFDKIR